MTPRGGTGESSRYNTVCWNGFRIFPFPEPAERQYVYLFTVGVSGHTSRNKKALGTCCRSLQCNHVCLVLAFTVRALLFSFMQIFLHQCLRSRCLRIVVGADYIYSFAITSLYICNCSSIRAADIYLSGSGSSDLDEYIQSQETQAIPTLCSLLALDQ